MDSCFANNNSKLPLRKIAFILAVQFLVCSTQPLWQPLHEALFGSCGGGTCMVATISCAAAPTRPGGPLSQGAEGKSPKGCCTPFQCCFPCCCFCQQPVQLSDFAQAEKNNRPNETTKTLHSAQVGGHFQPPEFTQYS